MDPLTQTLLGATAGFALVGRSGGRMALLAGAIGGALPDIDVLWATMADPDLPWTTHRHFTHALSFIPIGGAVAAAPLLLFKSIRTRWRAVLAAATVGYATHGLLDTCTAYGTFLYWPFVDTRIAWDVISIIDPVFTLVLLIACLWAVIAGRPRPVRVGAALAVGYLGLGFVQHERVEGVQRSLAAHRGQTIERSRVMPTIGNLVLWRSIYEVEGELVADAVRVSPIGGTLVRPGSTLPRYTAADLAERSTDLPRLRRVFSTFENFADGYVAVVGSAAPGRTLVGDMRYSLDPGNFAPLWGLCVQPNDPIAPAVWVGYAPDRDRALRDLWQTLIEPGPAFIGVDAVPRRAGED